MLMLTAEAIIIMTAAVAAAHVLACATKQLVGMPTAAKISQLWQCIECAMSPAALYVRTGSTVMTMPCSKTLAVRRLLNPGLVLRSGKPVP
jgi:hypothetical protein